MSEYPGLQGIEGCQSIEGCNSIKGCKSMEGCRSMEATVKKVGLKINIPKTKLMKMTKMQDGTVNIGQESVEEVKEFQTH